jgi:hypothetical protein
LYAEQGTDKLLPFQAVLISQEIADGSQPASQAGYYHAAKKKTWLDPDEFKHYQPNPPPLSIRLLTGTSLNSWSIICTGN